MSHNVALAAAARRVRSLNERLDPEFQIDVSEAWSDLLDDLEGLSDWRAHKVIEDFCESMEMRLSGALLHSPLDLGDAA